MKAITLWQPWATWIALGWKTIETRSHGRFAWLVGQRIAIHAGLTYDQDALDVARRFLGEERVRQDLRTAHPRGAIVCTVLVNEARRLAGPDSEAALCPCDYSRHGLILSDVHVIDPSVRCKGAQGVWDYDWPL